MTTAELWTSYKRSPNDEIKKKIMKQYSNLIHYVLSRTSITENEITNYQDYYQFGVEGLNQAIERYNPDVGTKFETYAFLRIKGKIIDELRKLKMQNDISIKKVLSLDYTTDSDENSLNLYDLIPSKESSPDDLLVDKELKLRLVELIKELKPRERKILTLYYYENLNYREISELIGITIPRICQIHSAIIKELKFKLNLEFNNN